MAGYPVILQRGADVIEAQQLNGIAAPGPTADHLAVTIACGER
ncbi:hypothetical protein [Sphingomonas bacterium]|nr:hypothetical protein [Sphingomonas bacterium]